MTGQGQRLKFGSVSRHFVQIVQLLFLEKKIRCFFLLQTIHSEKFGTNYYKSLSFVEWSREGEGVVRSHGEPRRGVLRLVHLEVMAVNTFPSALLASVHQEVLMFPGGSSLPSERV